MLKLRKASLHRFAEKEDAQSANKKSDKASKVAAGKLSAMKLKQLLRRNLEVLRETRVLLEIGKSLAPVRP